MQQPPGLERPPGLEKPPGPCSSPPDLASRTQPPTPAQNQGQIGTRISSHLLFGGAIRADVSRVTAEELLYHDDHYDSKKNLCAASDKVPLRGRDYQLRIPPRPAARRVEEPEPPTDTSWDLGAPSQVSGPVPPQIIMQSPTAAQAPHPQHHGHTPRQQQYQQQPFPQQFAGVGPSSLPRQTPPEVSRQSFAYAAQPQQQQLAVPATRQVVQHHARPEAPASPWELIQTIVEESRPPISGQQLMSIPRENEYNIPVVTQIYKCTGNCGRSWTHQEDVPSWSRSKPKKPWCNHCGSDRAGWWNEYKPQWQTEQLSLTQ